MATIVWTVAGTLRKHYKGLCKGQGVYYADIVDADPGYYITVLWHTTIYYIDSEGYIVDTGGSRTTKEDILDAVENMD